MNYLYNSELNSRDIEISHIIEDNIKNVENLSIAKLAELCNVSPSKITKYAKKLGFNGFKELQFQLKQDKNFKNKDNSIIESERLKIEKFFNDISQDDLDLLCKEISRANKIYLFGRGPSLKVCEYYTPRLRVATNKNIIANYDEYIFDLDYLIEHPKKLMIVLTVSGKNNKVHEILKICKENNIKTICISAYKNDKLKKESNYHINLLDRKEVFDPSLYKGRTLFYLYFEILTQELLKKQQQKNKLEK